MTTYNDRSIEAWYTIPNVTTSIGYTPEYATTTSTSSEMSYDYIKKWLEENFIKETTYTDKHLETPYDPIYKYSKLKCIDVMEYIIKNNWGFTWTFHTEATVPTPYANIVCTSSNGTPPRRRRYP